jgi:transcription elongation factor Elf1
MKSETEYLQWMHELKCPKCGSQNVELTVRQWAICLACKWGGMEFELTGYGDGPDATP